MYYNKANIQFEYNKVDLQYLERLKYFVNTNLSSKGTCAYVLKGYIDGNHKKLDHLRLSISMKKGTVEAFSELLNILIGNFCYNDIDVDASLREILIHYYIEYSEKHKDPQECFIPVPANECGCCLTWWDPADEKYQSWIVNKNIFSDRRKGLRRAWKSSSESNICLAFPLWSGRGISIIPNDFAKENHCLGLKNLLDEMTPYNPNWIVKCKTIDYSKKAYCYVKCDNQEMADKVFKKVSKLNRQTTKIIKSGKHNMHFNKTAEVIFGKMPPDEDSIYVIVKDDFAAGQIQLSEFGLQCTVCHSNKDGIFKCSKCKKTYYCSRECQIKDWKQHKQSCELTE